MKQSFSNTGRPLDADGALLVAACWVVVGLVAAFAFGQSYEHIYDFGRLHAQRGWTAKMLPLSVDLLIVAATLVLALQRRQDEKATGLALVLPRVLLYASIGATIGANVAYGLPSGWLSAVASAWAPVAFAGLVETVMVAVLPVQRKGIKRTVISAGQSPVPSTSYDAAKAAYAASVGAANPLTPYALNKRFGIPLAQARKIAVPANASLNGDGAHA